MFYPHGTDQTWASLTPRDMCMCLPPAAARSFVRAWAPHVWPVSPTLRFMEFEEEEEMQIQKLGWMKGKPCQPPPVSPPLLPQGPPAPVAVQQPGTVSRVPTQPLAEANTTPGSVVPSSGPFLQEQHVFLCAECPTDSPGAHMLWAITWGFFMPQSYCLSSLSFPRSQQTLARMGSGDKNTECW